MGQDSAASPMWKRGLKQGQAGTMGDRWRVGNVDASRTATLTVPRMYVSSGQTVTIEVRPLGTGRPRITAEPERRAYPSTEELVTDLPRLRWVFAGNRLVALLRVPGEVR